MTLSEPAGARIPIISTLERANDGGGSNFPLVSDSDLYRGFRSVDAIVDRDALSAEVAPVASFVWVEAAAQLFRRLASLAWVEVELGGGGAAGGGWIYITDIVPQTTEVISAKVFQDAGGTVLQSATADKDTVRVVLRASFPLVAVNATAAELTRHADESHYEGFVDVAVPGGGPVVATMTGPSGNPASFDTAALVVAAAPEILTLSFAGTYPGAQTELKEGDTFQITGTTDKAIDAVEIQNIDAFQFALVVGQSGTSFTVTGTVADRGTSVQALAGHVRARDAGGAFGSIRSSNAGAGGIDGVDLVNVNDRYPVVDGATKGVFGGHVFSTTYPGGQAALKDAEAATVPNPSSSFDTIAYDDPTASELSITSPAVPQDPKTVNRSGGAFNNSVDNFRITANRAANDATTVVGGVVAIADVAPTIDVTLPAPRLISGGNNGTAPQDHTVTIASDQPLLNAPNIAADAGGDRGTFQGAGFVGGPTSWARSLRVDETTPDEKGVFVFAGLVATGLAGRVQNVVNSGSAYTLGGFAPRNLTFAAFATSTSLGTSVSDFARLQAATFSSTGNTALKQSIGTSPDVTDGYTIDSLAANPTLVIWLDGPAAGANSGGTAQITGVEEVA